jgi:hypothetical protein
MKADSFNWISSTLQLGPETRALMYLLWVDGYSPQAAASELKKAIGAVKVCSGRCHLRAYGRAKKANDAAQEAAELKQRRAAVECARERGDAGWEYDLTCVEAAEMAFKPHVELASEAELWRIHLLSEDTVDYDEEPDRLHSETVTEHAHGVKSSMRGPCKSVRQTPEMDSNNRPIGAHPTLVTFGEYKLIVENTASYPARMPKKEAISHATA